VDEVAPPPLEAETDAVGEAADGRSVTGQEPPAFFRKGLADGGQIGPSASGGHFRCFLFGETDGDHPVIRQRSLLQLLQGSRHARLENAADIGTAIVDGQDNGRTGDQPGESDGITGLITKGKVKRDLCPKVLFNADGRLLRLLCCRTVSLLQLPAAGTGCADQAGEQRQQ